MTANTAGNEAPSLVGEGASLRPPCTRCGIRERASRGSWCRHCRAEAQKTYNERTRNRPVEKRAPCTVCGKEMVWLSGRGPDRLHCSTRCKRVADGAVRIERRRRSVSPERRAQIAERAALDLQALRRCGACGVIKSRDAFHRRGTGWQHRCIECTALYGKARQREAQIASWASHLRRKYKLSVDDWMVMLVAQSGRCAICLELMRNPHVDHDHACCSGRTTCGQCIRGLLCESCNPRIHVNIDLEWLLRAADYLGLY